MYRVLARNLAVDSTNKMHDDAVARQYGFSGGLVPGADVFGYMAHVPVERWGEEWFRRGGMAARFRQPVYDGDEVAIVEGPAGDGHPGVALEARNGEGDVCAIGVAELLPTTSPPPVVEWPPKPRTTKRHPPEPEVVAGLGRLGDWDVEVDAAKGQHYLDAIGETSSLLDGGAIAHPGWLVRCANRVLSTNVELGPWIHTASELRNFAPVRAGQRLSTRARVVSEYERKGHRFVELDVVLVADDSVAATIRHTAIYRPRPAFSG